jgi:hypothetical protein
MFLSCLHFNVSPFALKVSATTGLFAFACELRMAMFLRPRDYVLAPLHIAMPNVSHNRFKPSIQRAGDALKRLQEDAYGEVLWYTRTWCGAACCATYLLAVPPS